MPAPCDVTQLKSFIGFVNYYSKFLLCLADTLAPLYKLVTKHQPWHWGKEQADAFQTANTQLSSDVLLVHFDPGRKLAISCDASPYGIGAVLSHVYEDGTDRPIAYASRSLAPAEKKFLQIGKGLAVVWGVKKFHLFLYGREFVILSDHKPLQFLFNEQKPVPTMASGRIQRWALTLSAYKYNMEYRAGKDKGNVNALSRLPVGEAPLEVPIPGDTILMLQMLSDADSMVTAAAIRKWTNTDPLLYAWCCRDGSHNWTLSLSHICSGGMNSVFKMDVPFGVAVLWYLLRVGHPYSDCCMRGILAFQG